MPDSDLMALGQRAAMAAKDIAVHNVQQIKASVVNRPAWGRELKREERLERHRTFIRDPLALQEEYAALVTRFQVPEGHVPVRWGEYGRLARRELEQEDEDE